tara:strand:+ start:141 stop:581 length:441 start_codon:yes stop_codon:yes gene_type:complete
MTFDEKFYVISVNSYIKKTPNSFCRMFLKNLKNEDGSLKDHITDLNENLIDLEGNPVTDIFSDQGIKCTIPTLFIEVTYKDSDRDVYLINHEVYLYEDDYPTLKDLEAYKKKVSYGFASQVTQEIKDIVEAFHNGYGCECLSSGEY